LSSLRVLVVEDEAFLAIEVEHVLETFGCEVRASVSSVAEALRRLEESDDFDVALLDVNLRGETVFPVADALVERGIGFVFMTGYGQDGLRADLATHPVVAKPFIPDQLRHALEVAVTGAARA
jgi:CheY-like chemotaxis protein